MSLNELTPIAESALPALTPAAVIAHIRAVDATGNSVNTTPPQVADAIATPLAPVIAP